MNSQKWDRLLDVFVIINVNSEDRGRGGQRTEDRGQRTEDRGQRTEDRGQKF